MRRWLHLNGVKKGIEPIGHFQKPLNLKPEFGRRILEGAVRVNA
jgi:hypothetical protein